MTPLPAPQALDAYFLEARCRLLDLAAILDRIDRGDGAPDAASDPRMRRVREALEVLRTGSDERAAEIQRVFSLDYDPGWKRPEPR